MSTPLHVLLVEDSADDARLVVDSLQEAGYAVRWERVENAEGMRRALARQPWDAVLCDFLLPHFDEPAALEVLRASGHDLPFIIVSGTVGEDAAVEAMRVGAHDYVMKDRLVRLPAAIARELREAEQRRRRRQAEEALRESEVRYHAIMDQAADAIFVYDRAGRFRDVNQKACQSLGYTREELLDLTPAQIDPDVFGRELQLAWDRILAGQNFKFESRHRRKDGSSFHVEVTMGSARWGQEAVIVGLARDITEPKQADEARTRLARDIRLLLESTTEGIYGIDPTWRCSFINRAGAEMLGYQPAELLGRNMHDAIHARREDGSPYPAELCPIDRALREGRAARAEPEFFWRRDGSSFPVQWTSSPIVEAGVIRGAVVTFSNIAERKRAEEALAFSHTVLQTQQETSLDGILVVGERAEMISFNQRFVEMWELPEDLLSSRDERPVLEFVMAKIADEKAFLERVQYLYQHPHEKSRQEILLKNGKIFDRYSAPMVSPQGRYLGRVWFFRDITERKRTEAALVESESRYRAVFEGAAEGILIADPQTRRFTYANPALCRMFGYSPEEISRLTIDDIHPVVVLPRVVADFEAQTRGEKVLATAIPCLRKDRSVFRADIRTSKAVINGLPYNVGFFTDITENEQAQLALRESQARLAEAEEVAHLGYAVVDLVTGKTTWSDEHFRIWGYEPGQVEPSGDLFFRAVHPDDQAFIRRFSQDVTRDGGPADGEFRIIRPDGSVRAVLCRMIARHDRDGTPVQIFATALDITDRRRADERIREQAELLNQANDAIVGSDLKNRITYWNRGAERIFGWSAEEVRGLPITRLLAKSGVDESAEAIAAIHRDSDWRGEIRGHNRAGQSLIVAVSITVLRDQHGRPIGRVGICTDVTEKKSLEERFLRAQRLENIGMLAAGIAHDLNNVLAPVGMAASLLRNRVTAKGDRQLLDTLEKCATRGAGLVKQILGFARGVGGEPRLVQVKHLLRDVLEVIVETFPKSIEVKETIPGDLWPIHANPTQIHQVLLNLCVNARDAMAQGGVLCLRAENIELDAMAAAALGDARPGRWLVVHVVDSGTGIPPEILPRIWDPFFTTKVADKGTGLGLSTVLGIVKAHRGFIKVESAIGRGTVFQVYLPAAMATVASDGQANALPPAGGAGELILLVEDEALIRDTAEAMLTGAGYHVVSAPDGVEAQAVLETRAGEFALVITDLDMPRLDGIALAQFVQAKRPSLPILVMSGVASRRLSESHPEFTGNFLSKPFTADALLNEVHRLLHRAPLPH